MKKFKLDGNRIWRTFIQSAAGAGAALISALVQDCSMPAVISSLIAFASTVAIAILMNIQKQTQEGDDE